MKNKSRVAVGLSGGIDSAMTAYLLLKEGYDVIGLTMSTWDESYTSQQPLRSGCFGPGESEDIESAERICRSFRIPHYVVDLKTEYRETVLDYFQGVYLSGETPNPCVVCNREIKFSQLPEKAREMGLNFDLFATGHYSRRILHEGKYYIAKGVDNQKDQSYFLCRLDQSVLRRILLPLGNYQKKEIKEIAQQEGFHDLSKRKESQDFIESEDYGFIFGEKGRDPGDIVDGNGNIIGTHKGIIYYTVGQRRGLNLSGLPEPYYVLGIDPCSNKIIAGEKEKLFKRKLIAGKVIWVDDKERDEPLFLEAKIRLQHQPASCEIIPQGKDRCEVNFDEPQLSITPGQIVAFYDKERVIGSGVISKEQC
jgi:tRNA-specific 2-thiouridylase